MGATALRADARRSGRDPLAACESIMLAADAAGRPITLFERAELRQHVQAFERESGQTLMQHAQAIAATAVDGVIVDSDAREQLRLMLDVLDVIDG